jgi:exosortase
VLILPIAIFLIWYHREKIAAAPKQPSLAGLAVVLVGALTFVLAARALQPRLAIFALPVLIYGSVLYLWGRNVARVFLFPCAFLLFMVPVGGMVQGTVSLQLLVSNVVNVMSALIGVKIEASGTTIRSLDGSFNFEIAEGCSGIRSLMAMTTLTALYAHFTQTVLWKKGALFASSIIFAVIGNIGRIFTVILVAKFYDPIFASGLYHDYSGFVFFPIAVAAMVGFSNLLNTDWKAVWQWAYYGADPKPLPTPVKGPISYDY